MLEQIHKIFPAGFLDYPKSSDRELRWVLQWHFRDGQGVHGEMRFEQQSDLIGFTLAVQTPGLAIEAS